MKKKLIALGLIVCCGSIYGQDSIHQLEDEISIRKEQLEQIRLKGQNQMVESQGDMIEDWPKYSEDVEKLQEIQKKADSLKKEIEELEQKKAVLIKKST